MSKLELKTVSKQEKKQRSKNPVPRIECTICSKPAVRYFDRKTGTVVYEHRDEPPVRTFLYGPKRKKMYTYRRCYAGHVAKDGLEGVIRRWVEPKPQSKSQLIEKKEQEQQNEEPQEEKGLAYYKQRALEYEEKYFQERLKNERLRIRAQDLIQELQKS